MRAPHAQRPDRPADLHVHTTHSDGSCSPAEVVRAAASVGLAALAITDHDTLSALAPARREAETVGVELVPGIELTAERDGRELHILGYFIQPDDPELVRATDALREARARRIEAMTERLAQLGLTVDLGALARIFPRATLGRPHLADWLVRTGQVAGRREAFDRYLSDGGPAHVPKPRLSWKRAIELIRGAGGVAALAHPPYNFRQTDFAELAGAGLGALECGGPGLGARLAARWRARAEQFGLVPVAGSDFHAPDRPGRWVGAITTPRADLERLRALARSGPFHPTNPTTEFSSQPTELVESWR